MTKTFKYILFKSFMNEYYKERKEDLTSVQMKASLKGEVKAYLDYMKSLIWLRFYTGLFDFPEHFDSFMQFSLRLFNHHTSLLFLVFH